MGRPKLVSDERILTEARRAFVAGGASTTTATIAARLGVTHAALLQRFGTKQRLMVAALRPPDGEALLDAIDRGPDARAVQVQLVEICSGLAAYFDEAGAGLALLRAAGVPPAEVFVAGQRVAITEAPRALAAWVRRAQQTRRVGPCDPDALAAMLVAAIQNRTFTRTVGAHRAASRAAQRPRRAAPDDTYVQHVVEIVWRGVAPARQRTRTVRR